MAGQRARAGQPAAARAHSASTGRSSAPNTSSSSSRTTHLAAVRTPKPRCSHGAPTTRRGRLAGLAHSIRRERDLILDALRSRPGQSPRSRRAARHQPAHPALQARAPARGRHRRARRLTRTRRITVHESDGNQPGTRADPLAVGADAGPGTAQPLQPSGPASAILPTSCARHGRR